MRRAKGFTLLEVLVVFSIVIVLAALLLPALNGIREKGERTVAASNMRQIGTAIMLCANDRDGLLPGPLQLGQKSSYSTNTKQLACVLAPYLDIPEPVPGQTLEIFNGPAFARTMRGKSPSNVHPFLLNATPEVDDEKITPFGSDNPSNPSNPMKVMAVNDNVWVLCDADQQNPGVIGQPWEPNTPKSIIHGKERLALYLDGSVSTISQDELESTRRPPPPPPRPPPPPPSP